MTTPTRLFTLATFATCVGCGSPSTTGSGVDNVTETPDATAATSWDITIVAASFDASYENGPWDRDGSPADPAVHLGYGPEQSSRLPASTLILWDTERPRWDQTLARNLSSLELTTHGVSVGLTDADPDPGDKVRVDAHSQHFPNDDYIGSISSNVTPDMFASPEYVFNTTFGDVNAAITVRFDPVGQSCGGVPVEGSCDGDILRVCVVDKQAVYEVDCASRNGSCDPDAGACAYPDATAPVCETDEDCAADEVCTAGGCSASQPQP